MLVGIEVLRFRFQGWVGRRYALARHLRAAPDRA